MTIEEFRERRSYPARETLEALGVGSRVDLEENSFELADTPAPQLRFSGAMVAWALAFGAAIGLLFGRYLWPHVGK